MTHRHYSWRDYAIGTYFTYLATLGAFGLHGHSRFIMYSISSIIIGVIGLSAVFLKLRRLEATMLITWGFLLMARALLLIPAVSVAGNTNIIDYVFDVFNNRPLADGLSAILIFIVLASYRYNNRAWKGIQ